MRVTWLLPIVLVPVLASAAEAEQHADWASFSKARSGECLGGPAELAAPVKLEIGRHKYEIRGHRLVQLDADRDKVLRIGVISATKDEDPATLRAIDSFIQRLMNKKIDVLLINGDVATHDFNMEEKLLPKLASAGVLTIAHVGNSESCGQFNIAMNELFAKKKHFVNGNWVRQIELDDGTLFTLPGYHLREFSHSGGAAKYDDEDISTLKKMLKGWNGPKVLVAHGPPKMKGKRGLDVVSDGAHVGDQRITDLLRVTQTKFGIFGHILEAGGRGTDLVGRKKRKKNKWHPSLYVNAGTANPLPWPMLTGKTSYGMALYFELRGNKARYKVLRLKEKR